MSSPYYTASLRKPSVAECHLIFLERVIHRISTVLTSVPRVISATRVRPFKYYHRRFHCYYCLRAPSLCLPLCVRHGSRDVAVSVFGRPSYFSRFTRDVRGNGRFYWRLAHLKTKKKHRVESQRDAYIALHNDRRA